MSITDTRTATLAGRLRAARIFAGMEQAEIAQTLGVSRQSVSTWETGTAEIKASAMIRWCEITRVSLNWLAFGGDVRPEGFEPPAYCSVADDINWPLSRCQFCGAGFYSSSERDAHQWTCQPWSDLVLAA